MDKDQITTSVNANNSMTTTTTTITTVIATQNNEYITINYILNTFSILSSLLLLILIVTIRLKEVKFSNRISLRLIMYISITEIFFSITQMIRVDNRHFSIWSSYLSSWGYVFTTLLICSLIMSILINIQLTFIYNYKDLAQLKNLKRYYLMAAISFSILLSAIPITFGKFNFDQKRNHFWYDTIIWEWISYSGWITFTILYCLVSVITMSYHLNKRRRNVSQIMPYNLTTSFNSNATTLTSTTLTPLSKRPTQSKIVSKYISRIILYSLIPILGYLPTIITNLIYYYMDYTERNSFSLNLLSLIFISSQSIFTFIIFLFDPIIDEVILERKKNIEIKQTVLDNIQKGVYVANIYDVNRELPSNRESPNSNNNNHINNNRESPNNSNNHSNDNRKSRRNTIYNYALNAKNRISGLTFVLYNRKKSVEINREIKDVFELENEENDLLVLL